MDDEAINNELDEQQVSDEEYGQGSWMAAADSRNEACGYSEVIRFSGIDGNVASVSELSYVDENELVEVGGSVGRNFGGSGEDLGSWSEAETGQDLFEDYTDVQDVVDGLLNIGKKTLVCGGGSIAMNQENGRDGAMDESMSGRSIAINQENGRGRGLDESIWERTMGLNQENSLIRVLEESLSWMGSLGYDFNSADTSGAEAHSEMREPDVLGWTEEDEARRKRLYDLSFQALEKRMVDRNTAASFACRLHEETMSSIMKVKKVIHEGRNFSGPFASAFRKIKDQVRRLKSERQPIKWAPANNQNHCRVPSLVDLSLNILARNSEFLSSIEHVPCELLENLCSLVCDLRKMDSKFMKLLVAGSPEVISVKDCSWMSIKNFNQIFRICDVKNLRVLSLELCGECMFDFTLYDAFGQSSAKLCSLTTLSLKGAAGLTDEGLKSLTQLAPSLKSINLSLCSLITAGGVYILADSYTLKELYVDECPKIADVSLIPALLGMQNLEVLSISGIPTVINEIVGITAYLCSLNLKELRLADCGNLTDRSMKFLGAKCSNLIFLDLSNLDELSDFSLQYIANGCRSIQCLKLHRNRFSDEALGAFLEVAGHSLTELSLNGIKKVGSATALSIARHTRDLVTLDLSWCRGLSNEMVGLIVDSCRYLKLLKLFGCTQITEVFLKGHSNPITRIVGPKDMSVVDSSSFVRPIEGALRYSSID